MMQSDNSLESRKINTFKILIAGIGKCFSILKFYMQAIPVVGPFLFLRNAQIFIPNETSTTKDFSTAIQILCKDISFKSIICNDIGELLEEYPVVVVCQVSSRLEPDIDSAINGVKCQEFVVLLLHTGLEIPCIPTAQKLGKMVKYHNLELIDVAYNIDSKLYNCEMNESAKYHLKTFFENFYTKSVPEHRNYRGLGGLIRSFLIQPWNNRRLHWGRLNTRLRNLFQR